LSSVNDYIDTEKSKQLEKLCIPEKDKIKIKG